MLRGADVKPHDPYEPDVDNANVGTMTDSLCMTAAVRNV